MRAHISAILILVLIGLILPFQQYQVTQAQTAFSLESKTLAYVENVLPFDMSHYTITVSNAYCLSSGPNDPTVTQAVDVDLNSSDSTIHVVCLYANGALYQCGVSPSGSPPISDRAYASLKETAARILQAHQEQTGLDSTALLKTLSLVNSTGTANASLGDVRLSVSQMPDIAGSRTVNGIPVPVLSNSSFSVFYDWTTSANGMTYTLVTLSFDNGVFYNLQDERTINPISSAQGAAAQQENSTSVTPPQSTHDAPTQASQLSNEPSTTKKNVDPQKELGIPILIAALATVLIAAITVTAYKSKNQAHEVKGKSQKETNLFFGC
jgi:hypothetical protein